MRALLLALLLILSPALAGPTVPIVSGAIFEHCGTILAVMLINAKGEVRVITVSYMEKSDDTMNAMEKAMDALPKDHVHVLNDIAGCSNT